MASKLQMAIYEWGRSKFGNANDIPENRFIKLSEEFRELTYAFVDWRNFSTPENTGELRSELADCYLCLLALAESLHIDLESVGEYKLAELMNRVYEKDAEGNYVKVRR